MTGHTHGYRRQRPNAIALCLFALAIAVLLYACSSSAAALPEGRVYELVSPTETNGTTPGGAVPAPNGDKVNVEAQPFGDAATGEFNLYQATRTPSGWQTTGITPRGILPAKPFAESPPMFFTRELTNTIYLTEQPYASGDQDEEAQDLYQQSSDGSLDWISHGTTGGTLPISATYEGATKDGEHVAFDSSESLIPAASGLEENPYSSIQYLYLRNVSTGETELVNVNDNGEPLNNEGAVLGNGNYLTTGDPSGLYLTADYYATTTNAISKDGSKVFFESPDPEPSDWELDKNDFGPTVHLYMREDKDKTVALDNSAAGGPGSRYIGASEDGHYVFFMSDEGLAGDPYTDNELYVYDTDNEKLTAVSAAPEGSPAVDGAVAGVTALSDDGTRVYYVAKGDLSENENSQGQSATEGALNLYLYDTTTGENKFITQLGTTEAEPEPERTARLDSYLLAEHQAVPTPDGEVLVFLSERNLTGEDPDGVVNIYRYDNHSGQLICVTCGPDSTGSSVLGIHSGPGPGGMGGGMYDPPGESSPMSENGDQIFFETANTLVPEDQNGDSPPDTFGEPPLQFTIPTDGDVYEWNNGKISLISSGQPGFADLESVTPSGHDVFIQSTIQLTSQSNGGYGGLYDARIDGGFPNVETSTPGTCEDAEGCRGSSSNPVFLQPATTYLRNSVSPFVTPTSTATPKATGKTKSGKSKKKRSKKKKKKKQKKKAKHKRAKKSAKHTKPAHKPSNHQRS
jgi:hypothetical protein